MGRGKQLLSVPAGPVRVTCRTYLTRPTQLAVVVAAVIQHQSPLAIGNVLGSSISNVLGAFSLGLLFRSGSAGPMGFDRSSKIYTALLLLLTTVVVALAFFGQLGRVAGGVFVGVFALYVVSVGVAIYKGVLDAPEGSDDESSGGETSDVDTDEEESSAPHPQPSESSPLIAADHTPTPRRRQTPHGLTHHVSQLLLGFTALSLSGYLLPHTASALAAALHLSGTVLGITVLSLATTLPEKFVAVLGGSRGHAGIVVANTVGSNIFLLTLCLGVVLLSGELDDGRAGGVSGFELVVTWVAAAVLMVVVLVGPGRWAGGVMLVLYGGFLGLEFTVFRR